MLRNYRAAISHFQQELELNPKNYKAMVGLGFALLKEKKAKDAIGILKAALDYNQTLIEVANKYHSSIHNIKRIERRM
jgi:tetratricopeptide (TPR) repeat protein